MFDAERVENERCDVCGAEQNARHAFLMDESGFDLGGRRWGRLRLTVAGETGGDEVAVAVGDGADEGEGVDA